MNNGEPATSLTKKNWRDYWSGIGLGISSFVVIKIILIFVSDRSNSNLLELWGEFNWADTLIEIFILAIAALLVYLYIIRYRKSRQNPPIK